MIDFDRRKHMATMISQKAPITPLAPADERKAGHQRSDMAEAAMRLAVPILAIPVDCRIKRDEMIQHQQSLMHVLHVLVGTYRAIKGNDAIRTRFLPLIREAEEGLYKLQDHIYDHNDRIEAAKEFILSKIAFDPEAVLPCFELRMALRRWCLEHLPTIAEPVPSRSSPGDTSSTPCHVLPKYLAVVGDLLVARAGVSLDESGMEWTGIRLKADDNATVASYPPLDEDDEDISSDGAEGWK